MSSLAASARGSSTCRFCGSITSNATPAVRSVCNAVDCRKRATNVCQRTLPCGHLCCGVLGETDCPPCLYGCSKSVAYATAYKAGGLVQSKQEADDICPICHLDKLSAAPIIWLDCNHIFHYHCCKMALTKRWSGPRISFRFLMCPLCEVFEDSHLMLQYGCFERQYFMQTKQIKHKGLAEILKPLEQLYDDVQRKATTRLQYENMQKCDAITNPGSPFYQKPVDFAMQRYAYYICFKCSKVGYLAGPYYV